MNFKNTVFVVLSAGAFIFVFFTSKTGYTKNLDIGNDKTFMAAAFSTNEENLSVKEKKLVTIISLVSSGTDDELLKVHVISALNEGLEPEKIIDCLMLCAPYIGNEKVENAVSTAKKSFFEQQQF